MKASIMIIAILFISSFASAECIKTGTITKIIQTEKGQSITLGDDKPFNAFNSYKLRPGDFCKVQKNNQGDFYLSRLNKPEGIIIKTMVTETGTEFTLVGGGVYSVEGQVAILPPSEITLTPDCDGNYKVKKK